ncbi:MAG: hypothetical protein SF052_22290 [Bacteroidia bacterium]|nr:hypothetical protein [Bacteroidia bacterium]
MVSDYVITEHHTRRENPTVADDAVAIAWWPPDTHYRLQARLPLVSTNFYDLPESTTWILSALVMSRQKLR